MKNPAARPEDKIGPFQVVVLILSVIILGAMGAETLLDIPASIKRVLAILDTAICVVLLVDFCYRFYQAESKLAFMKWGWIDLIASIPNVPWLRAGRLVRILRVIRLLRAIRASQKLSAVLLRNKLQTGAASLAMTALLVVMFSSVAILICEKDVPNANIKTGEDAIWWSISTVTTVGYGDVYPVTTEGRIVAMFLMVAGIGLFGVLSGLAAAFFVGPKQRSIVREEDRILARLEKLEEKIDGLRKP